MKKSEPEPMTREEHLDEHLELMKRVYERMRRDNSWPWVVDPEGWGRKFPSRTTKAKDGNIAANED